MKYPVMIELGDEGFATGIVIPDIPGAITAGDTLEEALRNAVDVARIVLQEIADKNEALPLPSDLNVHIENPDYHGWTLSFVEIDVSEYEKGSGQVG